MVMSKIVMYNLSGMINQMLKQKMGLYAIAREVNAYLKSKGINDTLSHQTIENYKKNRIASARRLDLNEEQLTFNSLRDDLEILMTSITSTNRNAIMRKARRIMDEYQDNLYKGEDIQEIDERTKVALFITSLSNEFCSKCRKVISNATRKMKKTDDGKYEF